jgi:arylsulfatase
MNEKSVLNALTSTLIVAAGASIPLHAQTAPPYQGVVGRTLAESKEWWPDPAKAPAGAPNVVWILIDDVGYGAAGTFGGRIQTPTFDSLANNGLRYTNFHTTAICAPTRSTLLTGHNSATVHVSGFSHTVMSAGFPGWDGRIPSTDGTIAEILRENGYNTFAVGKYGVTADEDATDAGPFDRWPTGKGIPLQRTFSGRIDMSRTRNNLNWFQCDFRYFSVILRTNMPFGLRSSLSPSAIMYCALRSVRI